MKTVSVSASRRYDVVIQDGLLDRLGEWTEQTVGLCTVAVISDDVVFALYGQRAVASLTEQGYRVETFVFPHGEASKTLATYQALLDFLCDKRLSRSDLLIALGGGVVGDLVGFAAATYLRGVRFIQVPTTLLAMVDSSVGGKTGVDLSGGKNQVGCFYQPWLVVCDPKLLQTLPKEQYLCGLAEVIKYAVLGNATLFDLLKKVDQLPIQDIIATCVTMKRDIVAQDEFDRGCRQLLNLGHSFGHAVEWCSGFSVLHGQAVAIGMAMMAKAAAIKGFCSEQTRDDIVGLLQKYQLPVTVDYSVGQLYQAMLGDKKRNGSVIQLIVPKQIGSCCIHAVPTDDLPHWLADGGAV